MMRKITLLLLFIISLASSASAATHYVSDDLYTYLHSGPGTKYKIIGSVNSGAHIKLIQTRKIDGFTKIKDSRGRDAWINSKYVSKHPGYKERLAQFESKLTKLNIQFSTAQETVKSRSDQVRELEKTNAIINKELQKVQALNHTLSEKLDTKKNDLLMRWFSYGGMVAGGGLLFGLILPSLIPNRRKKSHW